MITAKSLFRSNVAMVFPEGRLPLMDNGVFSTLYKGDDAAGARFFDDPLVGVKALTLPKIGMKVSLEGRLLRVDDEQGIEPGASRLVADTHNVYKTLAPGASLEAFGFNLDVYYRFNNVLSIRESFQHFFGPKLLESRDLADWGMQFTLINTDKTNDTYFIKVVAPLEIAVHINRHFPIAELPSSKRLQALFLQCYNEADDVIGQLTFT